jgi:predicted secreted protein
MTVQFTNTTKFLVADLAIGSRTPSVYTLTTTANATVGATSLAVTATPGYLTSGVKVTVGTVTVTVKTDTPRGSTSVPIEVLKTGETIASAATGTYYELFEFIGGSDIQISGQESSISIRNFKSGKWAENAKVMTGVSFACQGQYHIEDIGLRNVIRPAMFNLGKEIYASLTRENGDVWAGSFQVAGYTESAALDNVVQVSFNLNSNGAVVLPAGVPLTV